MKAKDTHMVKRATQMNKTQTNYKNTITLTLHAQHLKNTLQIHKHTANTYNITKYVLKVQHNQKQKCAVYTQNKRSTTGGTKKC